MAMPYMEQVDNADQFYKDMIDRVKKYPNGIKKTVFELQATNWRNNKRYLQLKWQQQFTHSISKVQCTLHTIQMTQSKIIRM
jgi:biofilm PGA synthesis lipoprotein PgaB